MSILEMEALAAPQTPDDITIGGLFEGYSGLSEGIRLAFGGGRVVWYADVCKFKENKTTGVTTVGHHHPHRAPCTIAARHHPGVPNLGDVAAVDWYGVPRVHVLGGGSPCQDLSNAGRRKGMTEGTRSNLWVAMREAIAVTRPHLVVWENVRGALSAPATGGPIDHEHCTCVPRGSDRRGGLRSSGHAGSDIPSSGVGGHDGAGVAVAERAAGGLLGADTGADHPYLLAGAAGRGGDRLVAGAGVPDDAGDVGRDALSGSARDGSLGGGARLAHDGFESSRGVDGGAPVPAVEGGAGGSGAGGGAASLVAGAAGERAVPVDRGDASRVRGDQAADARPELEGTACFCPDCGGCLADARTPCSVEPGAGLLDRARLRPGHPVLRAAGRVVGDLSELGYDSRWMLVHASDVGAPHGRPRIFLLAADASVAPWWERYGDGEAAALARRLRTGSRGGPGSAGGGRPPGEPAGRGGVPVGSEPAASATPLLGTPRSGSTLNADPSLTDHGETKGRLENQLALLGTPTARMWKGSGQPGSQGTDDGELPLGEVEAVLEDDEVLLPTPAVNDMGTGYTVEGWDDWTDEMKARHGNGNGHGKSLSIEARRLAGEEDEGRLLPTPTAGDADSSRNSTARRGSSGDLMLPSAAVAIDRCGFCSALFTDPPLPDCAFPERHPDKDAPIDNGARLLPTPRVSGGNRNSRAALTGANSDRHGRTPAGSASGIGLEQAIEFAEGVLPHEYESWDEVRGNQPMSWGEYAPAIARWVRVVRRDAPAPTAPSKKGLPQLAARFVEWMMGLPVGWVTDTPGITRNEALKALGNGVVPQQAAYAIATMLTWRLPK